MGCPSWVLLLVEGPWIRASLELRHPMARWRPRFVLAAPSHARAAPGPGAESDGWGHGDEVPGRNFPESDQDAGVDREKETRANRGQCGRTSDEDLGQERDDQHDGSPYEVTASPKPTKGTGPARAAQLVGREGQGRRSLCFCHHLLEIDEGPRHPRREAVGKQADGHVALGAVPSWDERPGRVYPCVGGVALNTAPSLGMQRARR